MKKDESLIKEVVVKGEKGTYPGTLRLHEHRLWVFTSKEGVEPDIFMFQPAEKTLKEIAPELIQSGVDALMKRVEAKINEFEAGEGD